jgi:MYXO-CTERM domain-containing protein
MKSQFINRFAKTGMVAGALLTALSRPAGACGGFFCSRQQPVNQAAERIIFADNGDGTITAVIQIMYEGPSEKFSWLLPISTVPAGEDLAVASDLAFTRLQAATNPQYNLTTQIEGRCRGSNPQAFAGTAAVPTRETCDTNSQLVGCSGSAVNVEASGVVGQFEWSVISVDAAAPDPAAPALAWLAKNGYDVTPEGAALIGPYLADGMYLLALRLTKGADVGSIRPIQLTYAAEAPMIPIKLTAVAANEDMGVMTWALSNARAVPFNYNALELNEARVNWFNAASNYNQVVTEAADAAGGQGFVTEFAGPSAQLADTVWLPSDESDWQAVQGTVYKNFGQVFEAVYSRYQNWSGFWDAIRRSVTLPDNVSFADFKLCPTCYSADIQFSPTALLTAVDEDVLEPVRAVQKLIDRTPYTTRLYSTLSAAEMTADPVFVFNPDLPDVNNLHQATRLIECNEGIFESEAPWRIEFPQGSVLRGTPATVGQWPDALAEQPANLRVLTLARSGAGRVLEDNSAEIGGQLAMYNASVPASSSSNAEGSSGGFCSVGGSPSGSQLPRPLAVALGGLLGLGWLRRQRRSN